MSQVLSCDVKYIIQIHQHLMLNNQKVAMENHFPILYTRGKTSCWNYLLLSRPFYYFQRDVNLSIKGEKSLKISRIRESLKIAYKFVLWLFKSLCGLTLQIEMKKGLTEDALQGLYPLLFKNFWIRKSFHLINCWGNRGTERHTQ